MPSKAACPWKPRLASGGGCLVLFLCLCSLCQSCGYSLGRGPRSFPGVTSVHVPVARVMGKSAIMDAGALVAAAVRREVIRAGMVKLAPESSSDAELKISVRRLTTSAMAFPTGVERGEVSVGEYSMTMVWDVELVGRDGKVLFRHKGLEAVEEYLAGSEPIATVHNRRRALERLSARMAKELHDVVFQGF